MARSLELTTTTTRAAAALDGARDVQRRADVARGDDDDGDADEGVHECEPHENERAGGCARVPHDCEQRADAPNANVHEVRTVRAVVVHSQLMLKRPRAPAGTRQLRVLAESCPADCVQAVVFEQQPQLRQLQRRRQPSS